jgi:hypothetical protein
MIISSAALVGLHPTHSFDISTSSLAADANQQLHE